MAEVDRLVTEMNEILRSPHEPYCEALDGEPYPLVFIIGVPRSGTTLLSQLVSFYLNVSYINNLVAAFWSAPLYGIALSTKILSSATPSFRSSFGKTEGLGEPHEFGYFWKELFRYDMRFQPTVEIEERIDWDRVQRSLRSIGHAFGTAVTFKYLPVCWHLARLKEALPEALFVRVRRSPIESARSLIQFRTQEFGSIDYMASLMPTKAAELECHPYWVQVAGQVFHIDRIIDEQLADVPDSDVLDVTYEDICGHPRRTLEGVASLLDGKGYSARIKGAPPDRFEMSKRTLSADEEMKLREALREFYERVEQGRAAS